MRLAVAGNEPDVGDHSSLPFGSVVTGGTHLPQKAKKRRNLFGVIL